MKKRFLAILLTLCMVVSLMPAAYAASDDVFADVGPGDWFYDEVQYVYEKGLMQGTGDKMFSPHLTTTRGMIVAILYRLEGEPAVAGACPFDDVAAGKYYEKAVIWAAANSLVGGYGSGRFGPDDPITREQMAAILYRYAGYKGCDVSASADLSKFTDVGKISGYALPAMKWANAGELVSGKGGGILDPGGNAERCQAAAILYRFCENIMNKAGDFTVTFMRNDGSSAVYKTGKAVDGKTVAPPADPSRRGYTFAGWYTAASGGGRFDFKTAITADVTLYAHWAAAGGGGSPTTSSKTAATAADLIAAAQANATNVTATILEENSITVNDDITITNNSVSTLTLELGSASVGDLTINSASARTIHINGDTAAVSSLTVNAPNASVLNRVTVNGSVDIQAASHNTFENYAKTGIITVSGSAAVKDMQADPAQLVIATDKAVTVKGNSTGINVVADGAQLTVAPNAEVEPKVESSATGVSLTVTNDNSVTIAGTVDTVQATSNAPDLTVDGAVGSVDATAADALVLKGSGSVNTMVTGSARVEIDAQAKVNVNKLTATGGVISAPANTVNTVAARGDVTLNATVNTVEAAAGTTLTLGEAAAVNVVEAEGNVTLDGAGSVTSVDVRAAATINVTNDANVTVAQITTTAENTGAINVSDRLTVTAVQTKAPKPTNVGVTAPAAVGGKGKIVGVKSTMEYKPITGTWSDVSGDTVEVAAGAYLVRMKATETALASEAVTVTIPVAVGVSTAAIQGAPYVGQTLTAVANADATGTLRYEWRVGGNLIDTATGKTFKLTDDQIGKAITVKISNYDGAGKDSPSTDEVTVDKTALNKLIAKAAEVQQGVTEKEDTDTVGTVAEGVIFVTAAEKTALTTAVTAAEAEAVNKDKATSDEVSAQETALRAAIEIYVKAKKVGMDNTAERLQTDLTALLAKAPVTDNMKIETKAENVAPGTEWVTAEVKAAYETVKSEATSKTNSDDTDELTAAITDLNAAITAYQKAIRKGAALDRTALDAAINAAELNAASVVVDDDGADVLPSQNWVTQEVWNTYAKSNSGAIATAKRVNAATQSANISALETLNTATEAFNSQKQAGAKDIVPPVVSGVSATLNGSEVTVKLTVSESASIFYQLGTTTGDWTEASASSAGLEYTFDFTLTASSAAIHVRAVDAANNATVVAVKVGKEAAAVAAIGNLNYDSLQKAVAAAADGQTVKLLQSATTGGNIAVIGKAITLDLNGKTLTAANTDAGNIDVAANAGLTLKDSGGTGKIITTTDYSATATYGLINVNGSFIMESGTIDAVRPENPSSNGQFGIVVMGDRAAVTVNGGTIHAGWYAISGNGNSELNDGTAVTVNGGLLASTQDYAIYNPQDGTVNITDGEVRGAAGAVCMRDGELTVSGGTISSLGAGDTGTWGDGTGSLSKSAVILPNNNGAYGSATATITGGAFSASGEAAVFDKGASAALTIHGGAFSDFSCIPYCADGATVKLADNVALTAQVDIVQNLTIDMDGNELTSSAGTAFKITDGTLTMKGGDFTADYEAFRVAGEKITASETSDKHPKVVVEATATVESEADCCIFIYGANAAADVYGSLTSKGQYATIQGNGNADSAGTTINIYDGASVTAAHAEGFAMYIPQNGTLTIEGGTVSGASGIEVKAGTVDITGGTIKAAAASTAHVPNSNGTSTSGYAFALVSSPGYVPGAEVTISGGTFAGPVDLVDDDETAEDKTTLSIEGGAFSADPSAHLKTGYKATYGETTDTWTVAESAAD